MIMICDNICFVNYYFFIRQYLILTDFAKILDGMKEDWKKPMSKEEYEVVMKMAKLGRRISILSTFLTINAIWLGAVVQVNKKYQF